MNKKDKSQSEQIEKKVYKVKLVDDPKIQNKKFDLKKFVELAKKAKKTFNDEDLTRLESIART